MHDVSKTINIPDWLFNLQSDLFDIISQILKHGLGSLMEILGVSLFPELDPLLKTNLGVFSLETQSTDLMNTFDDINLILILGVLDKFVFEIFKLRVCLVERSEVIVNLSLPKPVELIKVTEESIDIILCSLDRTCKEKNNLNNFFILSNPVIEWLS
jgi:hypothetical protein